MKPKRGCRGGKNRRIKVITTDRPTTNTNKQKQLLTCDNVFKWPEVYCNEHFRSTPEQSPDTLYRKQTGSNLSNLAYLTATTEIDPNTQNESSGTSVMYFNARSVVNKSIHINDVITEKDSDIVFITETWLTGENDDVTEYELKPPGYNMISNPRENRAGGGICVILKNHIKFKQEKITGFSSFECTKLNAMNTTFLCVYHPPPSTINPTHKQFVEEFENLLELIIDTSQRLVILGDFNIHHDSDSDTYSKSMKLLLENNNLKQHVTEPTHNKGHIIDWIIAPYDISVSVTDLCISDHFVVTFQLPIYFTHSAKKSVLCRNLKKINIERLNTDITNELETTRPKDGTLTAEALNGVLAKNLDRHAPLKKIEVTDRQPAPWLSDAVLEAKRRRRVAERKWLKSTDAGDRIEYQRTINEFKATLISAKQDYYKTKIESCPNSKCLFNVVSEMCGNSLDKHLTMPNNICEEELPAAFSDYFRNKVEGLRDELDSVTCDNVNDSLLDKPFSEVPLVRFDEISESEVEKIILASPPKSCSLDPIPTTILLKCLESTLKDITAIINYSLRTGTVPDVFKQAVVIPLLKKSNLDQDNLKNYRPVSNLPFLSKILEKVVLKQLNKHLQAHRLIETYQSAYRAKHSTESALLKIVNDILLSIDKGDVCVLALLDLSAAFDTLDHSILRRTLEHSFGLRGPVLSWFSAYLSNRNQTVCVGNHRSESVELVYGVPQGSVLGPVLYTLYTMSLGQTIEHHSMFYHMYADDTQIYVPVPLDNVPSAVSEMEECCSSVKNWMHERKLKLNDEKTEIMICGTKQRLFTVGQQSFNIGGNTILSSDAVKNLGVYLDCSLSMENHIHYLVRTTNFAIRNIYKLKKYLPISCLKTLVTSLILSRLDYCNSLLAGLPENSVNRLQRVQNRAARLVLGVKPSEMSTNEMLRLLHWLPVTARVEYKMSVLCFGAQQPNAPQYIADLVKTYSPSRVLRSSGSHLLSIPKTKLKSFGDRAFSKFGPTIWNSLPLSLRQIDSEPVFKKLLKTFLFTKHL